jgi:hypothetical protein
MNTARRATRWLFAIAAALLLLYAANVALGMLAVKLGVTTWRLGDVGEFLLVLSCMAFFVAGLIADEAGQATAARDESNSNALQGGEQ